MLSIAVGILSTCTLLAAAPAEEPAAAKEDWPQLLGQQRDGIYRGDPKTLAPTWPAAGPKQLWEKKLGAGWSSPIISGGKLILFHRQDDKEVVECLNAADGKPIWKSDYETTYRDDFGFDEGPRGTPTIAAGRVFTFGAEGTLSAWDLATGKQLWSIPTRTQLNAGKGYFGMACSPLVEGSAVIVNIGGKSDAGGAGIVAFDAATGKILWQATNHEAGYSSPIAATFGGNRWVLDLTRAGLVGLAPDSGKVHWIIPFRSRTNASVNAATPLVIGEQIFLTASYGTGAALLKFDPEKPAEIWRNDETLSSHYATPIHRDGYLYGIDGRQEAGCSLRCIELKTGKIMWTKEAFGAATLMLVGEDLLVLTEKGDLVRVAATPESFKEIARAKILDPDVRAGGALSSGLYYARDGKRLVCIDLRK